MSSDEPTDVGGDRPRRRLDVASLALLLTAFVSAGICCWLVAAHQVSTLAVLPSIIAVIIGATHLTKMQAPHDGR